MSQIGIPAGESSPAGGAPSSSPKSLSSSCRTAGNRLRAANGGRDCVDGTFRDRSQESVHNLEVFRSDCRVRQKPVIPDLREVDALEQNEYAGDLMGCRSHL
jgi:hypothetical protein